MIDLRPGQREVAAYRGGLLAVPAVPGAGKTTVLAHLASELIAEDRTKPGEILIVTAMNSAAANFRSRIAACLEERGLPRSKGYEVKTLHSLAMAILKEKPEFLLINEGFQVLDEPAQTEIVRDVSARWLGADPLRWQAALKVNREGSWQQRALGRWRERDLPHFFKQALSYIKTRGIDLSGAAELLGRLDAGSFLAWSLEVYLEYAKALRAQGLLDFDDLIAQALRLLQEDEGVLARLQQRWTYIFEDEAQDSNPLQEKILHLLAGEKGNLIRVGDSNQAILGTFTAAEPEIFRSFCVREDVLHQRILCSSRSTRQVIDLANYLVKWTGKEHPQVQCRGALEQQYINPVSEGDPYPNPEVAGYTLAVKRYRNRQEEISGVARLAWRQVEKNPDNTLAILVPTRLMQQEISEKLLQLGAEFEEVGKVRENRSGTVFDIKIVLDYLVQPHKVEYLTPLLERVLLAGVAEETAKSLAQLFERYKLEEVLYPVGGVLPWLDLPDELWEQEVYARFVSALARLRDWLQASISLAPEDLVLLLAEDLDLAEEQLEIANNLALLVKQRVGENPAWKLIDIARDLPRIEDSLKHFARVVYDQKGFIPRPGVITLLTAHKAKGLEWDTVFIPGVTAAEYPSSTQDKFRSDLWYLQEVKRNPLAVMKAELDLALGRSTAADPVETAKLAEISERLRLLYVAVTRARKNLLLSYHDVDAYDRKQSPGQALRALQNFMAGEAAKYGQQA